VSRTVFIDLHGSVHRGVRASVGALFAELDGEICSYQRRVPRRGEHAAGTSIEHHLTEARPRYSLRAGHVVVGYTKTKLPVNAELRKWLEERRTELLPRNGDPSPKQRYVLASEDVPLGNTLARSLTALTQDLPENPRTLRRQARLASSLTALALWHRRE